MPYDLYDSFKSLILQIECRIWYAFIQKYVCTQTSFFLMQTPTLKYWWEKLANWHLHLQDGIVWERELPIISANIPLTGSLNEASLAQLKEAIMNNGK